MKLIGKYFKGEPFGGGYVIAYIHKHEINSGKRLYYWIPLYAEGNESVEELCEIPIEERKEDSCNWYYYNFKKKIKSKEIEIISKDEARVELL